jgi:hypothetical protein
MSASAFFNALARLLATNPPPESEAPMLDELATIGVIPGQPFDSSKLEPAVAKGLDRSVSVALERLQSSAEAIGTPVNGWHVPPANLGNFASDYRSRAYIAAIAFGANLPADAVYPTAYVDADGKALNGANRYVIHFDPGQTPPVNAFWPITMYDPDSFFVANPIGRYAVSSWMPLRHNADGSIDIYLQHDSPGSDLRSNWLPSATGAFNVTLRMYWPKEGPPSILDGSWKPPAITRIP